MQQFFSIIKSAAGERSDAYRTAQGESFDDLERLSNRQHRHPTLGQSSLAAFEPQAAARPQATPARPRNRIKATAANIPAGVSRGAPLSAALS